MREAVISLKTFLFVEWCYAEPADVPGFTPLFVSCTNNTDIQPFRHLTTAFMFSLILKIIQISLLAYYLKEVVSEKVLLFITLSLGQTEFVSPLDFQLEVLNLAF
jgi:hypothetical protein